MKCYIETFATGLTPKIPCDFLPNFAIFDIVGKSISQK
jgi:hypothetical protein